MANTEVEYNQKIQDDIQRTKERDVHFYGPRRLNGSRTHPLEQPPQSDLPPAHKLITDFQNIIGLPPTSYTDTGEALLNTIIHKKILQSMVIINISPAKPSFEPSSGDTGINLFSMDLKGGETQYYEMLKSAGVDKGERHKVPIQVAVLNDFSITDSFTHEYADSQLESTASGGGGMAGEISQITGNKNLSGTLDELGKGVTGVDGLATTGKKWLTDKISQGTGKDATKIANMVDTIAGGAQVDFPMIWKGSSYTPSYSFTCRLINPMPQNEEAYQQYIIEPLARLLVFGTNSSESPSTFNYPLMCEVSCPGLFHIKAAYFQSIEVIKGGDANDIAWFQRPGTVDIRFTIGSLYSTMIAKGDPNKPAEDRPTLKGYLDALKSYTYPPIITIENAGRLEDDTDVFDHIFAKADQGALSPNVNDRPNEPVVTDPDRLSIEQNVRSSDPVLNETNYQEGPAPGEPAKVMSNVMLSNTTQQSLDNLQKYKREMTDYLTQFKGKIPPEDEIALRIRNNIPIPEELKNWYVNNYDSFSELTKGISGPVENAIQSGQNVLPTGFNVTENRPL